jgi:Tfp pilus assembly protein PilX
MKNPIQNQKGIALITTLMLLVLGFAVVAILFRLSTQETKLTRLEQDYSIALDAAKGATDLFIVIVQNGFALATPPTPVFGATYNNSSCLQTKMTNPTPWSTTSPAQWTAAGCPSATSTTAPSAISSNPTDSPDITFVLNNYTVNLKVIDNTTTTGTGTAPCANGCYYYTVVARAQLTGGTGPQANVTFVYRYSK